MGQACTSVEGEAQERVPGNESNAFDSLRDKYAIRDHGFSDLVVDFDKKYEKYNHDEQECGGFRLLRAHVLCFMSGLVYCDGSFWSSKRPGVGNFRDGLKGMSSTFKFMCGAHDLDNEYSLRALSSSYDMDWDNGIGTLRDGLINYSSNMFSGDAQAMITLRLPKKQVIVAFRGTESNSIADIITDLRAGKTTRKDAPSSGSVHTAIQQSFKTIEKAVIDTLKAILASGECTKVLCTGHSLGGGLATLCAIACFEQIKGVDVEVYTFGGAAVGDQAFVDYFNEHVKVMWRVVNDMDAVPNLGTGWLGYKHCGKVAVLNENGLFVSRDATDDAEGTITESITDHSVRRYMQYMDLFDALSHTTHHVAKLGIVDSPMQTLIESYDAFHQYVHVQMLTKPDDPKARGVFHLMRHMVPNKKALKGVLGRKLNMTDVNLDLLEPEMLRLVEHYKRNQAAWPNFVIAMYNLYFCSNENYKTHCQEQARWYGEFMLHDLDGDGFIDKKEFEFMAREEMFTDLTDEMWAAKWKDVADEFDSIESTMSHDGLMSFKEYAIWRMTLAHDEERKKNAGDKSASPRYGKSRLDRMVSEEDLFVNSAT